MRLRIKVDRKQVLQAFRKVPRKMSRTMRRGMKEAMGEIQERARDVHRYKTRTGQAERSVQQSVHSSGLSGRVYLDRGVAVYSPSLHEGHGTWAPDRFLYKAARKERRLVLTILDEAVEKAFKQAGF